MAYPSENRPTQPSVPPLPDPEGPPAETAPPLPDELARTLAGLGPAGEAPPGPAVPRTRASMLWVAAWPAVALLILLIVFVAQNTGGVPISFLWMDGRIPLALALLLAGVAGAVIAMAVAGARIAQLRRLVRKRRR
ncbi:membrane protein [Actinoplanes sp. NBRC 14428]|uniref:Putative integral membrane protein n=1 Tax=Pseudosporangium ferrugineum TaxID=439699 RepID=A0A2T0RFR0_9ACTN|nr:lipopolysaccharide assembly protein LapA domain-containing protein [Pseudosporangium ferrugineum]PRY19995.1 putative integral membrane protein [Pseudosporangium ferrugineum]BCJ51639.1 membrane protein [Actinoplanes sp. NBRC 14428]